MDENPRVTSGSEPTASGDVRARVRRRPLRVRRPDAADLLQEQIKQIIIEDQLAPGQPMPTELDLIERPGAGRSSIREALKALRAQGLGKVVC